MTPRVLPRTVIAISTLVLGALPAQGNVTEDWTRTLMLNGSHLYGAMIGVDAHDAIYVTGYYPNYHIVTSKFAPSGTQLWQAEFANPGTREQASWLTVDRFGDVVVAGYTVAGGSATPGGFVTLKYDPAGNLLWSDSIASTYGSLVRVATDANGDVVVLGRDWFQGIVTIKYSRAGTRLWTRTASLVATNQNYAGGLALDAAGNVYVTGGALGATITLSYDPAGNLRWSRSAATTTSGGQDLVVAPTGEVYVCGAMNGTAVDKTMVAKFDAAGAPVWQKVYPGLVGLRLALDSRGNVIVISYVSVGGGYFDWLTHKLDAAGTLLWSASYDKHRYNDEIPYALVIGRDDEIYVTGQGGPGPSSGNLSYLQAVTVRYSKSGVQEWAGTTFTSLRNLGLVQLSDNSIATVGQSTFTIFHYTQSAVWRSLGDALAGSSGLPRLEGTGSPHAATAVTLEASRGLANAPTWLVGGVSRVNLPLFGGVLVPAPDLLLGGFVTSQTGTLSLPLTWPVGLPQGFEITFQAWIADQGAPYGFAATNALVGISG